MLPTLFDSGVPRSESDALVAFYTAAQRRLRWMITNPAGRTDSSQMFRRGRASEQIRQVDAEILRLKRQVATWTGRNVPAAMREGLRHADRQAREAGVRPEGHPVVGSFSLIDRRAVELLAKDSYKAADAISDRHSRVFKAISAMQISDAQVKAITDGKNMPATRPAIQREVELKINQAIAGSAIEGTPKQTIKQLAADLAGVFGGTIAIIDKNGDPEEWDVKTYVDLVVRTRTREVMESARHQRLEDLGIDLVAVIGKVSDNFCSAFLGQVFSLSGKHPKYPPLDSLPGGGPPFHPNCSKSTRPFIEELATEKQLEAADGPASGDSNKLLGMKPQDAQKAFKDLQLRRQVEDPYTSSTVTDKEWNRRRAAESGLNETAPSASRPGGGKISQILEMQAPKGSAVGKAATAALGEIDKLFSLPDSLRSIPIKQNSATVNNGQYVANAFTGEPLFITVSSKGPTPHMTSAHEFGHYLDHQALGTAGKFACESHPDLEEWRKVVKSSKAVQDLIAISTKPSEPGASIDHGHVKYLLRVREIWARSFAQYVATRGANEQMRKELSSLLRKKGETYYPRQWTKNDFEPIAKVMDKLFKKKGWSK